MIRISSSLVALLFIAPLATAAPTAEIADGNVVVSGLLSTKGLSVVVAEGTEEDIAARPPMAGEWSAAAGKVVFTPKYPLRPGTKYRVTGGGTPLEVRAPAAPRRTPARLTHIYPAATELPANVLRFYLEFDQPMPRGEVYKHVRLLNEKGGKDPLPFLEIDDELWNADQTRVTLLVDPGRIKKEVKPRIDLGPVFEQGKKYTLVVSGKWPTLSGDPIGKDVTKAVTATEPISGALDPKTWTVTPPTDGKGALTVAFGRLMDHPLLARCLTVLKSDGQPLPGAGEPTDQDSGWTFRPTAAWVPATYTLRVDTVLEDVCGNRIGRPFEIDLLRPAPAEVKANHVDLAFVVGR
jgi:hypothetical protein